MDGARLAELLRALYESEDDRLRREHHRSLPFQDAAFDRWDRARRLGFGEGTSIYNSAAVFGDVFVGHHTWIGPNTLLDGSGGSLRIGAFCSVSSGVQIFTHDTVLWALSGGKLPRAEAPVSIGDCCYIGSHSIIASGVTIGNQCVIGANSYVNHDVADSTIAAGSPARRIGLVVGTGPDVRLVFDSKA